jgi:sporulation protein YlmC with PRC-barrel domain
MPERQIDLVYRLLDSQLLDVNGRRCGRVDDFELEGGPGEPVRVVHILSGHGAWAARLPRRWRDLGRRVFGTEIFGENVVRVPWSEVADVDQSIHLRKPAGDLGLGRGDERWGTVLGRLPGS